MAHDRGASRVREGVVRRATWPVRAGAALRALRVERLQLQGDVADRAGMSRQNLSHIETGRHAGKAGPQLATLLAVLDAMGATLADFERALAGASAEHAAPREDGGE